MRLLAITPGDGRALLPWLEALARAGVHEVLVREPQASEAELDALTGFACAHFERTWVHTRHPAALSIARAYGVGVHQRSGETLHHEPFAVSCHGAGDLDSAFASGAHQALLSPVWRPTSKPEDSRLALGPQRFMSLAGERRVFALGGITAARAEQLRHAGAYGVAVLGGLFGLPSPAEAHRVAAELLAAR